MDGNMLKNCAIHNETWVHKSKKEIKLRNSCQKFPHQSKLK